MCMVVNLFVIYLMNHLMKPLRDSFFFSICGSCFGNLVFKIIAKIGIY